MLFLRSRDDSQLSLERWNSSKISNPVRYGTDEDATGIWSFLANLPVLSRRWAESPKGKKNNGVEKE